MAADLRPRRLAARGAATSAGARVGALPRAGGRARRADRGTDAAPPPRASPGAPAHLLALRDHADAHSLGYWAARYLTERVAGGAANTLDAKGRDLAAFIAWFVEANGHGEIGGWQLRDTQRYLAALERLGRAPATINRALATLRHFARFVHEQPGAHFATGGMPTAGVRELACEEADCRKLSGREVHLLLKAADRRIDLDQGPKARPRRNRALFAVLYYTGLRVQELVALRLSQRQGAYLVDVTRKGRVRSRRVYLPSACQEMLEDYLARERPRDAAARAEPRALVPAPGNVAMATAPTDHSPLFLAQGSGRALARQDVARALARIADEASKHSEAPIHLHPHRLRHTFGAAYRDRSGSDTETAAALGHTGLKYVGRYVRRTQAERDQLSEDLYAPRAGEPEP